MHLDTRPLRRVRALRWGCALAVAGAALGARPAQAMILPPVTLDGPSADIVDFGGVAIAADGTGGAAYTKMDGGVPHVFAVRYAQGRWSRPLRVDGDRPYDAASPRIAADTGGRLLVAWVTQMATVHQRIQRGLVSAVLGRGADSFGSSLVIDANVGSGSGVTPSLSGTAPGRAIVAYRVVTNDFTQTRPGLTAVRLRPGDVMADVRLARLTGPTWARLGSFNRNPDASMRPPGPANGPLVATGPDGDGVVAWQEPDQTGAARIWLRRIFGTVSGPPLLASPSSWEGRTVGDDADAFSLDVTGFGQARVAMRVSAGASSPLGGPRLLLNTLPTKLDDDGGRLIGAVLADGGAAPPAGGVGIPSVSASDRGGGDGGMWLASATGTTMRLTTVDAHGALEQRAPAGPPAAPNGEVVTAVSPAGGGIAAWTARDGSGRPVVGVRQDFPSGAAQTAAIAGTQAGPVGQLSIGRADSGDAIVAFRQGEPGRVQIVATRVTVPPATFALDVAAGWVPPRKARIRWDAAPSAVGGLRYDVLLDGRPVARGLTRRSLTPAPRLLGDGVRRVQVRATDALGAQTLGPTLPLRIDARPPVSRLAARRGRGAGAHTGRRTSGGGRRGRLAVVVRVRDAGSGVRATTCAFGDRTRPVRATRVCRHVYARAGRYTIVVRSRDRVGNRTTRRLPVVVR